MPGPRPAPIVGSVSQAAFRDLVTRMAVDPEVARRVGADPEAVGLELGLTAEEIATLRSDGGDSGRRARRLAAPAVPGGGGPGAAGAEPDAAVQPAAP